MNDKQKLTQLLRELVSQAPNLQFVSAKFTPAGELVEGEAIHEDDGKVIDVKLTVTRKGK